MGGRAAVGEITGPCEFCGDDSDRAFVRYEENANDAQLETEWGDGLPPTVYAIVCMTCGEPVGFIDPREEEDLPPFNELPHGPGGKSHRVDDVLK